MTATARRRAISATAALLLTLSTASVAVAATPARPGTDGAGLAAPAPARVVEVDAAVLRWAVSREAGNAAFAPGTHNFLSAGKVADPGSSRYLRRDEWSAVAGPTRIQKAPPGGGFRRATWAGLRTTVQGDPITSPTAGLTSGNRVAIGAGTGTLAPVADDARISWRGSFTIAFYSGLAMFTVSRPTLVVENGRGTLTATLGGWGTSMADPEQWDTLPARRVVIARLRGVDVTAAGLRSRPAYARVRYDAAPGETAQVRTGDSWGAWPTPFVDYQRRTGLQSYWLSSGASTDPYKAPLAIDVAS